MPTKSKIKPPPTSVQQGDSAASKQMTEEEKPTNNDLDSKVYNIIFGLRYKVCCL